ncbi:MAG: protein arginine kinase [Planctomycetota bacterium]
MDCYASFSCLIGIFEPETSGISLLGYEIGLSPPHPKIGPLDSTPIDPRSFASEVSSWLTTSAKADDVVVSCRIRLARNLSSFPFAARLSGEQAQELAGTVRPVLSEAALDGHTRWVSMEDTSLILRLVLRERHLISRDLSPANPGKTVPPGRAIAFGDSESISVMVNEEDHLRIQSITAGFDLEGAHSAALKLDRFLEQRLPFAVSKKLGYLTGCPTNVGTGLRASVMLHLPALSLVRTELEKVFTAAQRTGLAVRGLYGEGSRAAGDFFQISNQVTLGRDEASLVEDLQALVPVIAEFERKVRRALLDDQRAALSDRVSKSLGVLRTARSMATDSALAHLSNIRLGHTLGLIEGRGLGLLNALGVQIQKGHIQALNPSESGEALLEPSERDSLRAVLLRRCLA